MEDDCDYKARHVEPMSPLRILDNALMLCSAGVRALHIIDSRWLAAVFVAEYSS